MLEILYAVLIIGGLGLIFGIGLSYASKVFAVQVDERVALIRDVLPGPTAAHAVIQDATVTPERWRQVRLTPTAALWAEAKWRKRSRISWE